MRARELWDVIEVLVLPSLWSALQELNKPRHGNRTRARLLVKQSFEQLRMGLLSSKPKSSGITTFEMQQVPPLGQLEQRDAGAQGDPAVLNTGGKPAASDDPTGTVVG